MDGDVIIKALWEATGSSYGYERTKVQSAMKSAMAEILKGEGFFVFETEAELREEALEATDLVEPEAE